MPGPLPAAEVVAVPLLVEVVAAGLVVPAAGVVAVPLAAVVASGVVAPAAVVALDVVAPGLVVPAAGVVAAIVVVVTEVVAAIVVVVAEVVLAPVVLAPLPAVVAAGPVVLVLSPQAARTATTSIKAGKLLNNLRLFKILPPLFVLLPFARPRRFSLRF